MILGGEAEVHMHSQSEHLITKEVMSTDMNEELKHEDQQLPCEGVLFVWFW